MRSDDVLKRIEESGARAIIAEMGGPIEGTPQTPCSLIGGCLWMADGEDWPEDDHGPLVPLVQIVVAELPYTPSCLSGVEVVSIFASAEMESEEEQGDSFVVRAYGRSAQLVGINPAEKVAVNRPRMVQWKCVDDYPDFTHLAEDVLDSEALTWLRSAEGRQAYEQSNMKSHFGVKLRGWPRALQRYITDPRTDQGYFMQFDCRQVLPIGDGGILHVWAPVAAGETWYCEWDTA